MLDTGERESYKAEMDGNVLPAEILPKESTERTSGGPAFWPGLLLALAATSITVGILWDISWHTTIGRDTFWTPAHMAIYLGGTIGGCVGGWLAIQSTFFGEGRNAVTVLGARAPLGAWVAIWGAVAMLTSAPFDNWWHNAYGLDVRIISVPHALLGLGMLGISLGALLLTLSWQNQQQDGAGGGLFVYVGGVFVVLGAVFIMEYSWPNMQHTGRFFEVAALTFPFRLVTLGRAGRISWPATRSAAVFLLIYGLMIWILPLFPAEPKLAPIYNKLTHMVPPPFPVLLIFPALAMDLVLRRRVKDQGWGGWLTAMALGTVFLAVFIPVQWFFAEFLLSPGSHNWFFAGDRIWSYGSSPGSYRMEFWDWKSDPLNFKSAGWSWVWATASAWVGLRLGGWMRKVQR